MEVTLVTRPVEQLTLAGEFAPATVALPGVDWTQQAVVVVDMGEQRTGGYSVEITEIKPAGSQELDVRVRVRRPGPGGFVVQAFTHPHASARFPRAWLSPGPLTLTVRDENGQELARRVVAP